MLAMGRFYVRRNLPMVVLACPLNPLLGLLNRKLALNKSRRTLCMLLLSLFCRMLVSVYMGSSSTTSKMV